MLRIVFRDKVHYTLHYFLKSIKPRRLEWLGSQGEGVQERNQLFKITAENEMTSRNFLVNVSLVRLIIKCVQITYFFTCKILYWHVESMLAAIIYSRDLLD